MWNSGPLSIPSHSESLVLGQECTGFKGPYRDSDRQPGLGTLPKCIFNSIKKNFLTTSVWPAKPPGERNNLFNSAKLWPMWGGPRTAPGKPKGRVSDPEHLSRYQCPQHRAPQLFSARAGTSGMELKGNKILSHPHWIFVLWYVSVPWSTKIVHKHSLTNYCKFRKSLSLYQHWRHIPDGMWIQPVRLSSLTCLLVESYEKLHTFYLLPPSCLSFSRRMFQPLLTCITLLSCSNTFRHAIKSHATGYK